MRDKDLTPIGPGFYVDNDWRLYFHVGEFLAHFGLPDTPAVREVVWDEVRQDFGEIGIHDLAREGEDGAGGMEND